MKTRKNRIPGRFLIFGLILFSCGQSGENSRIVSSVKHPEWSRTATLYEVNLRQYTESGTFAEFATHLPRLKEMGVDIIWLMPIHPIGEKNRKGSLGSYYSVRDYLAVNPEHGTLGDFKQLVQQVHELDMHIIIDWVANHTAWDNALAERHPEWYKKDEQGNFMPPVPDWHDVIALDYEQPGLRAYMIDALKYWVRETGIDGYRCDVAGMVPMSFWNEARAALDKLKPVFMLAEAEGPAFHEAAFDMTYGWELHHIINLIAQGHRTVASLDSLLQREAEIYPEDAYRMQFTSNHDENSWQGHVFERMGAGAEVFAVLTCTIPDMPLVYSGQEAGLDKRLDFFDKDPIPWRSHAFTQLYRTLFNLKQQNHALWNGVSGGRLQRIANSDNDAVFSFIRDKGNQKVLAVLNLTGNALEAALAGDGSYAGSYTDLFSGDEVEVAADEAFELDAWHYRILVQ